MGKANLEATLKELWKNFWRIPGIIFGENLADVSKAISGIIIMCQES